MCVILSAVYLCGGGAEYRLFPILISHFYQPIPSHRLTGRYWLSDKLEQCRISNHLSLPASHFHTVGTYCILSGLFLATHFSG